MTDNTTPTPRTRTEERAIRLAMQRAAKDRLVATQAQYSRTYA